MWTQRYIPSCVRLLFSPFWGKQYILLRSAYLTTIKSLSTGKILNPQATSRANNRHGVHLCKLCPLHHNLLRTQRSSFTSNSPEFFQLSWAQQKPNRNFLCKQTKHIVKTQIGRGIQNDASNIISFENPDFRDYVVDVLQRYHDAQETVGRIDISERERRQCSRKISDLASVAAKIHDWVKLTEDLDSIQQLYQEDQDKEMQELASLEIEECKAGLEQLQSEILKLLSPVEPTDHDDAIVEFTAGVGGQEAMLFTGDMFDMYRRFSAHMGWRFQVMHFDTTDLGGLRHATASVSGNQAYKRFKFEAGVHRVQRVPKTEKAGRVHTSTMTVAVLPQPEQIDIKLESKDLRIETKKATGPGGQHVNTTDTAVRITHLPTGFVVACQQERSQIKNKQIAMNVLKAKIYSHQVDQQTQKERSLRKEQVGTSARSEKIRTYNYAQDRITDHRLGESTYSIDRFLSGTEMLEEMVENLVQQAQMEALIYDVEKFVRDKGHGI